MIRFGKIYIYIHIYNRIYIHRYDEWMKDSFFFKEKCLFLDGSMGAGLVG